MHQIEPMDLNSADADFQGSGNFSIGMAESDEAEDLTLPRGNVWCGLRAANGPFRSSCGDTFVLSHRGSFSMFVASVANDGNCVNEITDMYGDPTNAITDRLCQMRPLL